MVKKKDKSEGNYIIASLLLLGDAVRRLLVCGVPASRWPQECVVRARRGCMQIRSYVEGVSIHSHD